MIDRAPIHSQTFSPLPPSLSLPNLSVACNHKQEEKRREREREKGGDKQGHSLVGRVRGMIQVEIVEYQLDSFLPPPLELVRTVRPRWIRIRISRGRDHPCLCRVAVENDVAEWRCNRNQSITLKRWIRTIFANYQLSRIKYIFKKERKSRVWYKRQTVCGIQAAKEERRDFLFFSMDEKIIGDIVWRCRLSPSDARNFN